MQFKEPVWIPFPPVSLGYFLMTLISKELISLFLPSHLHEGYGLSLECVFKTLNHIMKKLRHEVFPSHEPLCSKHVFRTCTS